MTVGQMSGGLAAALLLALGCTQLDLSLPKGIIVGAGQPAPAEDSPSPSPLPSASPTACVAAPPALPVGMAVSLTAGVITRGASTNFWGYTIIVGQGGSATYTSGAGRGSGQLSPTLAQKFFADLAAAQPLATLPEAPCVKSASFGSTLTVSQGGQQTPDLSCAADLRGQALAEDAGAIATALGVTATPRANCPAPPPLPQL